MRNREGRGTQIPWRSEAKRKREEDTKLLSGKEVEGREGEGRKGESMGGEEKTENSAIFDSLSG